MSEGKGQGEGFILIGKVLKPHGIKGGLRVRYFNPDPLFLLNYSRLYLKDPRRGIFRPFEVKEVEVHREKIILRLKGVEDRDAADRWAGSLIYVRRGDLPPLEEGEYYWEDILGLEVYTVQGEYLGRVVNIIPTGGRDVYEVKGPKGEVLLPAVEGVIREIDLEGKRMLVQLPEEEE